MGNVLETIRLSLLQKRISALVEVMPNTMITWKNRNEMVSTLAATKGNNKKPTTEVPMAKPIPCKTTVPICELDLGSGEIGYSGDLRGISLCTVPSADEISESETSFEEIPIVEWEYMTTVPVYTWEELSEEQLWEDYSRQHTPPVGTIPIEEFSKMEMESNVDVTESADGDTVILFQRSRKNRISDGEHRTEGFVEDGQDEKPRKNSKSKWNKFSALPYMLLKRLKIKDSILRTNRSLMKGSVVS